MKINGSYKLEIKFDIKNGRAFKTVELNNVFETAEEFIRFLQEDLEVSAPLLDKYFPQPEPETAQISEIPTDA